MGLYWKVVGVLGWQAADQVEPDGWEGQLADGDESVILASD
jgi:hypothetical protein